MPLLEIIPYDYIPYAENIYEKRIFNININIDFPMLLQIASNLENPDMSHIKKSISRFLYGNATQFWASILEEKSSISYDYEESEFLENALMYAYTKNDLIIKNM